MVAGSCRGVLSGSGGVCEPGPMRCGCSLCSAGGWLYCDLPSRSRAHLCRGHVPAVQASKAPAILNSAGTKWANFASMFARKVGLILSVLRSRRTHLFRTDCRTSLLNCESAIQLSHTRARYESHRAVLFMRSGPKCLRVSSTSAIAFRREPSPGRCTRG